MPTVHSFKDLKITFKPHPITGDLQVTSDEAAVKQAVINLILTVPGERFFDKNLGSNISRLLFEPMDASIAALIKSEIYRTITNYEPRVTVQNLTVFPDFDENSFSVALDYKIRGREDPTPRTINFLLQRTQ